MEITVTEADFNDPCHAEAIMYLTNSYAKDEMGGGEPIPDEILKKMVQGLREIPHALTFIAYLDGEPVGIANCFIGYSTYEAQKLINIHDLAVVPRARGNGIGEKLLLEVQKRARKLDCCRLTLEVRNDNRAVHLYERFGFENEEPEMLFMTKEFY